MLRRFRFAAVSVFCLATTGVLGSTLLHAMPVRVSNAIGVRLLDPLLRRFELHPIEPIESYAGIIVLGGSSERMFEAGRLARTYSHLKVLASGWAMPDDVMQRLRTGIEPERLEIEYLSRTTYENAHYAALFLKPEPEQRWLLVTSAFHMPRAMGLFREVGFFVEAYPVDWQTTGWADVAAQPVALLRGFDHLDMAAHEWVGLIFDRASGRTSTLFPGP